MDKFVVKNKKQKLEELELASSSTTRVEDGILFKH